MSRYRLLQCLFIIVYVGILIFSVHSINHSARKEHTEWAQRCKDKGGTVLAAELQSFCVKRDALITL